MPFLSPSQQYQSTEGKIVTHSMELVKPRVFQPSRWPLKLLFTLGRVAKALLGSLTPVPPKRMHIYDVSLSLFWFWSRASNLVRYASVLRYIMSCLLQCTDIVGCITRREHCHCNKSRIIKPHVFFERPSRIPAQPGVISGKIGQLLLLLLLWLWLWLLLLLLLL